MASSEPSLVIEVGRVIVATTLTVALALMYIQCNVASCDVGLPTAGFLSTVVLSLLGLPPLYRAYTSGLRRPQTEDSGRDDT